MACKKCKYNYEGEKVNVGVKPYKKVNAIIIPDNATNGDRFMAAFPNVEIKEILGSFNKKLLGYRTWLGGYSQDYPLDWWNAPYKAESEEE